MILCREGVDDLHNILENSTLYVQGILVVGIYNY